MIDIWWTEQANLFLSKLHCSCFRSWMCRSSTTSESTVSFMRFNVETKIRIKQYKQHHQRNWNPIQQTGTTMKRSQTQSSQLSSLTFIFSLFFVETSFVEAYRWVLTVPDLRSILLQTEANYAVNISHLIQQRNHTIAALREKYVHWCLYFSL